MENPTYVWQGEPNERDHLVFEIMALGYLINKYTDLCVFIDFSGHVDQLGVEFTPSKERFQDRCAGTKFYTHKGERISPAPYPNPDPLDWLKEKRDTMRAILTERDIDMSGMERIPETTYYGCF